MYVTNKEQVRKKQEIAKNIVSVLILTIFYSLLCCGEFLSNNLTQQNQATHCNYNLCLPYTFLLKYLSHPQLTSHQLFHVTQYQVCQKISYFLPWLTVSGFTLYIIILLQNQFGKGPC